MDEGGRGAFGFKECKRVVQGIKKEGFKAWKEELKSLFHSPQIQKNVRKKV